MEKNFKYKLAITNYDQDLIDWCVGIGYEKDRFLDNSCKYLQSSYPSLGKILDVTEFTFVSANYRIDHKEHPELTKALLAATSDDRICKFEYITNFNDVYRIELTDSKGYFLGLNCNNQRNSLNGKMIKLTFNDLLYHFNCKLSGKEIVSKEEKQACKDPSDLFYTCEECKHESSSICLKCYPKDKSKGWEFEKKESKKITNKDIFTPEFIQELKDGIYNAIINIPVKHHKVVTVLQNLLADIKESDNKRNVGNYECISQRMAKLKKQTRKLIKERNKLYEGKKKKQYVRKGKTEITFEYFDKPIKTATTTVKLNPTYFDRLRTERDRLKSKYYGMLEFPFGHGLSDFSSREWNTKLSRIWTNLNNIEKKLNKELLSFSYDEKEFEKTINSIGMPYEMGGLNFIPNTSKETCCKSPIADYVEGIWNLQKPVNSKNPTTSKEITIKCKRKDCNYHSKKKCSLACPEFVSGGYCGSYDKVVEMDIDNRKYTIHSEGVACKDFKLTFADIRTIMFNYYDKFLSHNMYNIGTESMRINKHIVSISAINALWEKIKELKNAKT